MSAPENPYAPWKLPVIGPLWVIQTTMPVAYFIGVPIVATNPDYGRGMDGRHDHGIITIRHPDQRHRDLPAQERRQLNTHTYLISQWAKGVAFGVVWVVIGILEFSSHHSKQAVGYYSLFTFVLEHPGILAGLFYASRAYTKYGGDAGADNPGQDAPASESTSLLRDDAGEV